MHGNEQYLKKSHRLMLAPTYDRVQNYICVSKPLHLYTDKRLWVETTKFNLLFILCESNFE